MEKGLRVTQIVRLGLVAIAGALFVDTLGFRQLDDGPFGPATWPQMVLVLLAASAAADAYFSRRTVRVQNGDQGHPVDWRRVAIFAGCLSLYVAGMVAIGFPLATLLFCIAWLLLHGFQRPIAVALISLAVTAAVVLIFLRVLYLSLPRGMGAFYEITNFILAFIGR